MANTIQTRAMLPAGRVPPNLILYGRNPAGDPPSPASPKGTVDVQFLVSQLMIGEGDITEAEVDALIAAAFDALRAESRSGDDAQAIAVSREASFNAALDAQVDADTPLFVWFQEHISPYAKGTLGYIAPRSRSIETIAVIDIGAALSGFNLHAVKVDNSGFLAATMTAQESSDRSLFLVFDADVSGNLSGVAYNFKAGDIAWAAPRSALLPPRLFNLRTYADQVVAATRNALKSFNAYIGDALDTTPMRVYQANHLPGIVSTADLDGDYLAVFADVDRAIDPAVNKDQIDEIRLFVAFADGSAFTVHNQAWGYVAGSVVIPFNISPTEEGNARLQQALATTPGRVRFAVGFYETNVRAGGFVFYDMPISAAFRVAPGGASEAEIDAAVDRYLQANPPPAGEDATARAAAAKAQKDADAAKTIADGNVLTQAARVGLLQFSLNPPSIKYRKGSLNSALERTLKLLVSNASILTGDAWFSVSVQGQTIVNRVKWSANSTSFDLVISNAVATAIENNDADADSLDFSIIFHDAANAGNVVGNAIRVTLGTIELPASTVTSDEAKSIAGEAAEARYTDAEKEKLGELSVAPRDASPASAAAIVLDADTHDILTFVANANFTFNITNGDNGQFVVLRVLQDATGSRVMTLNNAIVLDGRDAPVLSTVANAHDNVLFMKRGASWVYMGIIKNG